MSQDEVYATEPIAPEHFTDIYLPEQYLQEELVVAALEKSDIQPHAL